MIYGFKLRTGFFKTQPYSLHIVNKQLILKPPENSQLHRIVITDANVVAISIVKSGHFIDIEINAQGGMYRGTIVDKIDFYEISNMLQQEFGRKIIVE